MARTCVFFHTKTPPEKPEDERRFLWMSSYDNSDVENVGYPQAIMAFAHEFGYHRHFGHVPKTLPVGASTDAGGKEIRKQVKRALLAFCCSPASLLCGPKFPDGHTRLVRLTEEQDMTTQGGFEYALGFVRMSDAGCITLFGALPCPWGTSWQ